MSPTIDRRSLLLSLAASGVSAGCALHQRMQPFMDIGLSLPLSGAGAYFGAQVRAGVEIWSDMVNAAGGLLGRNVRLRIEDDHTDPQRCAEIYAAFGEAGGPELLLGPYMTPQVEAALPVIAARGAATVSILATGANDHLGYDRYFSMIGAGPEPSAAISGGFFDLAADLSPRPRRVALLTVEAGLGRAARAGARRNAAAHGFDVIEDSVYPHDEMLFKDYFCAIAKARVDLLFIAALPRETQLLIDAAWAADIHPRLFGGIFVGFSDSRIRDALGTRLAGIISNEGFSPDRKPASPRLEQFANEYARRAARGGLDPSPFGMAPFGFAAGETLEAAVRGCESTDGRAVAGWLHSNMVRTLLGDITFGPTGEWAEPGFLFVQYQHCHGPDMPDETRLTPRVVWPAAIAQRTLITPFRGHAASLTS
jgi:branched-chain amino acid transport system substrate-binding protein